MAGAPAGLTGALQPVREAVAGHVQGRTAKGLSEPTRASYRDAIERLAVPFFGTTRLEHIDPPTLRRYIDHLAKMSPAPGGRGRRKRSRKGHWHRPPCAVTMPRCGPDSPPRMKTGSLHVTRPPVCG